MENTKMLEIAQKTIKKYQLCDNCVGRLFRELKKVDTNKKKGESIRNKLKIDKKISSIDCWLCQGLIDEIPHFAHLISESLKNYEFNTFLVGSKVDEDIILKEKDLWDLIKSEDSESIKMEINREIGKILEKKLGKIVDFLTPEIMAVVDTAYDVVNLQIKSIFIYGRYKKLKRGIPQTKWFCKFCRGIGCRACNYKGKLYDTSVEELISKEAINLSKGTDESFHGSGREDIDALMLGNGRPFVLEIKNPKIRTIDLILYKKRTNEDSKGIIEINNLRLTNDEEIVRIKSSEFNKIYKIVVESEKPLNKEKLKEVARILQGKTIKQLTPTRVSHRRAQIVRERKIYNCGIESVEGNIAKITIETESGMYIKELISGDKGRTTPNLSDMIGNPCTVKELDVTEIKGE
jgi:tRNA pseudouridine synthase 10